MAGRHSGANWGAGGGGSAMGVSLVSNVPLPANPTQTQNVLATESKGVSKSEPKPQVEDQQAIAIPEKNAKKKKPIAQSTATERKPPPQPEEASNVVPFGEGGPVSGPYAMFAAGAAKGGFGFTGGGGDFGSRFSWYVRVVNQKVSENWLKYEVDPRIQTANRVYLTFDIERNGRPANIRVEQSSGVPSLDVSALRALQRIDTFGPLPSDYSGSKVSVEFWFDYKR
jgi:protein TonB